MNTFAPIHLTLDPPDRPDHLATAVLQSLSRPIGSSKVWGPFKSFFLAAISFGILPLLAWPKGFGGMILAEQQQIWHLVEWLRLRTGDPAAAELRNSLPTRGAPISIWLVPLVLLGILAVRFGPWITLPGFNLQELLLATYRAPGWLGPENLFSHWFGLADKYAILFDSWTSCLALAYLSHWMHVRGHLREMKALARQINPILARQQLQTVSVGWTGLTVRPFWIAAGLIGAALGAWWAIPAALAGASQRRYITRIGPNVRGQLALCVRMALLDTRPAVDVPTPYDLQRLCANRLCGKPAIPNTSFCARCGMRLPLSSRNGVA